MADDFTPEHVTKALMAVVACAGNVPDAQKGLARAGLTIRVDRLKNWVTELHREQFEQLREKHADTMERQLAHDCRDIAALASRLEREALDKAASRLYAGDDKDPVKTAMMASRVKHTAVDKLMQLTNRPQKITETRDVSEVVRSLASMGVLVPLPAGSTTAVADDESEGEADEE